MLGKRSILIIYLLFIFDWKAQISEAKRPRSFREPRKYCGPRLTELLHDFCEFFYGPSDIETDDWSKNSLIANECCDSPCSILHIILSYCKMPKAEAIRNTFGGEEVEYYNKVKKNISGMTASDNTEVATTISPGDFMEKNVRRKKHIRRRKRKKRKCKCRKDPEQIEKEKFIMARMVPEYIIGLAEYPENEPVIISNSL